MPCLTPDNIMAVDAANRPEILRFVQQTRARVVELAKGYKATNDQNLLDEIQMEKAKIANLNNQLMGFVNEQKQYMMASDKNQIARGESFDYKKYDSVYSKNSTFNIDADGNLGFITDGVYDKWSDMSGKWNVNNNIYNSSILKFDSAIVSNAKKGSSFDEQGVKNNMIELFKQMGPEEIQVAAEQDVTGDAYENLSFKAIWSGGGMDPKYYEGFEAFKKVEVDPETGEEIVTYDTKWMFDDNNSKDVVRLMSNYAADTLKTRHDANYVDPSQRQQGKPANYIIGGQTFNARDFNNSFVPFINKLAKPSEGETFVSPTGMKFKYEKGKYYVYNPNTREIDEDNPMTFNDVAVADGWANFLTDKSGNVTSGSGASDSL